MAQVPNDILIFIYQAIHDSVSKVFGSDVSRTDLEATPLGLTPNPELGDLAFPCFQLASLLKKNPMEIATKLAEDIAARPPFISSCRADSGYLNFHLDKGQAVAAIVGDILEKKGSFGRPETRMREKIMVEFSGPNSNKPLHLGHARNTLLGQSLVNILRFVGHTVIPVNIINERGIHICYSMLAYQKWGEGKTPKDLNKKGDHFVGDFYVLFGQKLGEERAAWATARGLEAKALTEEQEKEFSAQSPLMLEAHTMLKKWEDSDSEVRALWELMNSWVFEGFNETYARLGVEFEKIYYESDTYSRGKEIVLKQLEKGTCYRRFDNAVEIDLEKYGLGKKVLIRPNGTTVYVTQDIGLAPMRFAEYDMDRMIYVVMLEQDYHFKVLFSVLKEFGYQWVDRLQHLSYGMVSLPEGKMKSREGKVVDTDDILDFLTETAKGMVAERHPDIAPEMLAARAELIGVSAFKYFMLHVAPRNDMHYDPKKSLSFEGDTGPYLLYAFVRIQSIFRKAKIDPAGVTAGAQPLLDRQEELDLAIALRFFPDAVTKAARELDPSVVTTYLISLSQSFSRFYNAHQVIGDDPALQAARLSLVAATAQVLQTGLALLGVEVVSEM